MNRLWKFKEFAKTNSIFILKSRKFVLSTPKIPKSSTKPLLPFPFLREYETQTPTRETNKNSWSYVMSMFSDKRKSDNVESMTKDKLSVTVSKLRDEILMHNDDVEKIEKVLEEKGVDLFRRYNDGAAAVQLLIQLKRYPLLTIEVLNWRRKQCDFSAPMTVEEYSRGIKIAGTLNNVDLAIELFNEASNKKLKSTSLYNALMSAYSYNGLAMKCQSVLKDLKAEPTLKPSIATYNILISAFGSIMLVDHMEAAVQEITDLNLRPTIHTYKGLITGYITAWMWNSMEKTYRIMKEDSINPDCHVHLLMLRGYAHAGNLEKMEEMYEIVKDHVDIRNIQVIRSMIRAYSKSSDVSKVEKVEELLKRIPKKEYKAWLNILLICFYANEDLLEQMENCINEAIEHKTYITTVRTMRCIIASYFRQNDVDKLADFLHRAEDAGWKVCRSLYHCQMVMYSSQVRISEMESVLDEMGKINMPLSKKTYWILYKTYRKYNQRSKLEQVIGMMYKNGYGIPLDACDLLL